MFEQMLKSASLPKYQRIPTTT